MVRGACSIGSPTNVVLPLLPVPLAYFGAWLAGIRKRLLAILRDGPLCFYCTSLAAVCLNDNFKSGKGCPRHPSGSGLQPFLSKSVCGVAATSPLSTSSGGSGPSDETRFGVAFIAIAVLTTFIAARLHGSRRFR
jgi:hypothetical protein